MMKKRVTLAGVLCGLFLALLVVGCGQAEQKPAEPDYADDEVISSIASGLENRFDVVDSQEGSEEGQSKGAFAEAVNAELDVLMPYRSREFEDHKLQEQVLSYINLLEDSLKLTEQYPIDSDEFYEKWSDLYSERLMALKTFVEAYGLAVDEKHQPTFDEMMVSANAAGEKVKTDTAVQNLVESIVFEQTDNGYGLYTYTATVQNTTGLNLENVGLLLAIYDADGVKAEEAYAGTSSWQAGETVKFETVGQTNASQIKVSIQYYDVVS